MLRMTSGALLAAGVWPGALEAAESQPPRYAAFDFLVVNDLHHMSPECTAWLRGVARQLRGHRSARLCLVLGDLTDTGSIGSMEAVRGVLRSLPMPVHVQIGNHDYASATDRAAYTATFPGRLNYSFVHRGWQFVGLDSTEGQKYTGTLIQEDTFAWVHQNLRRLRPEHPTVLFTHFPMGEGVQYRPRNADALLDLFRRYNLRAVFSGHYHALTERQGPGGLAFTTNRCCSLKRENHDGSREKGYFLCRATADGTVSHEFIETPVGEHAAGKRRRGAEQGVGSVLV
jgi:3',5'-cyclic AMP phosphodiesterase CpdA